MNHITAARKKMDVKQSDVFLQSLIWSCPGKPICLEPKQRFKLNYLHEKGQICQEYKVSKSGQWRHQNVNRNVLFSLHYCNRQWSGIL